MGKELIGKMRKVFISHSSRDKDMFVRPLVEKLKKNLGEDRLVYDELTFEAGAKIIEEIRRSIEKTDLFVLLLSKNSLSSEWVKQEIIWAQGLDSDFVDEQRIMPVIIDDVTKYNHEEIPDWLRNYNIKKLNHQVSYLESFFQGLQKFLGKIVIF